APWVYESYPPHGHAKRLGEDCVVALQPLHALPAGKPAHHFIGRYARTNQRLPLEAQYPVMRIEQPPRAQAVGHRTEGKEVVLGASHLQPRTPGTYEFAAHVRR